jgi:hypothetical protein
VCHIPVDQAVHAGTHMNQVKPGQQNRLSHVGTACARAQNTEDLERNDDPHGLEVARGLMVNGHDSGDHHGVGQ